MRRTIGDLLVMEAPAAPPGLDGAPDAALSGRTEDRGGWAHPSVSVEPRQGTTSVTVADGALAPAAFTAVRRR